MNASDWKNSKITIIKSQSDAINILVSKNRNRTLFNNSHISESW